MQHVGDDGSRESEHEVSGFPDEQVTPRSRLMADERIDGRQSGAAQTKTIDEVDRFMTQRKPATVRRRTTEACGGSRLGREALMPWERPLALEEVTRAVLAREKVDFARNDAQPFGELGSPKDKNDGRLVNRQSISGCGPVVRPAAWKAFFQITPIRCPRLATRVNS